MKCGVWNQMKIWSSHLLDNLSNCLMNLKNSGDSMGFVDIMCLGTKWATYDLTEIRQLKGNVKYLIFQYPSIWALFWVRKVIHTRTEKKLWSGWELHLRPYYYILLLQDQE